MRTQSIPTVPAVALVQPGDGLDDGRRRDADVDEGRQALSEGVVRGVEGRRHRGRGRPRARVREGVLWLPPATLKDPRQGAQQRFLKD